MCSKVEIHITIEGKKPQCLIKIYLLLIHFRIWNKYGTWIGKVQKIKFNFQRRYNELR